jgi:hypothetical protein
MSEATLLVIPYAFAGAEAVLSELDLPALALFALGVEDGALIFVVEGEFGQTKVEIVVRDCSDAGVVVVCDFDAFEFEKEDLCAVYVVESVGDVDLVLERCWW